MRQIKFRAWDTKISERMIYGIDEIRKFFEGIELVDELLNPEQINTPEIKIMQFTGLKDKNGKEIYEGDIVKNSKGRKGLIYWFESVLNHCWDIKALNGVGEVHTQLWGKDNNWEVIGNKFENPELLK